MNPFNRNKRNRVRWNWCWGGQPGESVHYMRPADEDPTRQHVVTHLHASLRQGGTRLLTILDGGTVIGRFYVHGQRDIPCHFEFEAGHAFSVYLDLCDDPENVGALTVSGYTQKPVIE